MKRHALSVLAVASLCVLAVLLFGFVGDSGPTVGQIARSGPMKTYFKALSVSLDDGRVRILYTHVDSSGVLPIPNISLSGHHLWVWHGRFFPNKTPDFRRWLWAFDAHALDPSTYLLSCPIWFAALPCLIAPAVWIRKRRRREAAGFSVIENKCDTEALRHREEERSKAERI